MLERAGCVSKATIRLRRFDSRPYSFIGTTELDSVSDNGFLNEASGIITIHLLIQTKILFFLFFCGGKGVEQAVVLASRQHEGLDTEIQVLTTKKVIWACERGIRLRGMLDLKTLCVYYNYRKGLCEITKTKKNPIHDPCNVYATEFLEAEINKIPDMTERERVIDYMLATKKAERIKQANKRRAQKRAKKRELEQYIETKLANLDHRLLKGD